MQKSRRFMGKNKKAPRFKEELFMVGVPRFRSKGVDAVQVAASPTEVRLVNKALFLKHDQQIIRAEYAWSIFSSYYIGVPRFELGTPTTPR
jgi:hypothetical protein